MTNPVLLPLSGLFSLLTSTCVAVALTGAACITTTSVQQAGTSGMLLATSPKPAAPASTTSPAGWQYQQTASPSGTTYKANLDAVNPLQLAYPYEGGSTVTLTLRAKGGTTHAYLSVSKGMFAPSYTNGSAQIRFDNGPATTYTLSAAANGRSNLLFIDDDKRLLRQLRTARTMVIQLLIPGQKLNALRFTPTGLRWNN